MRYIFFYNDHNSSRQEQWGFFNKNWDAQLADSFISHSKLNVVKHSATGQGVISGKGAARASAQNSLPQSYLNIDTNFLQFLKLLILFVSNTLLCTYRICTTFALALLRMDCTREYCCNTAIILLLTLLFDTSLNIAIC